MTVTVTVTAIDFAERSPRRAAGQGAGMSDSLKQRVRAKLMRQLAEDGPPDREQDDPRQISVEADLEALDNVAADDPVIEELAARYLVF